MKLATRMLGRDLLAAWLACWSGCSVAPAAPAHTQRAARCVKDREGLHVCVPVRPHRIACDDILCFESLWTLGEASAVVSMRRPTARWIELAPHYREIQLFDEPNLEELLAADIDLAFVYKDTPQRELYAGAGITPIVAQSTTRDATDLEHFLSGQLDSLRMYGQALGGSAERRAQRWIAYVRSKIDYVTARTRQLTPAQRVSAYYVRGPDVLTTHGVHTCTYWYAQLAGVDLVTGRAGMITRSTTSAEQLVRWNPDMVMLGRLYNPELVLRDARFSTLSAVQRRAVYALPGGIFFWDGGPESVLLMLWIAKTAHPELFPDLELTREIRAYYAEFYGLTLSDQQLSDLLSGRGPDGRRVVRLNN
jgi:iron complex transport system substrate-binding protein